MTLNEEAKRATAILRGRTVKRVTRHREGELMIEFEDGARLLADADTPLALSITLPDECL